MCSFSQKSQRVKKPDLFPCQLPARVVPGFFGRVQQRGHGHPEAPRRAERCRVPMPNLSVRPGLPLEPREGNVSQWEAGSSWDADPWGNLGGLESNSLCPPQPCVELAPENSVVFNFLPLPRAEIPSPQERDSPLCSRNFISVPTMFRYGWGKGGTLLTCFIPT